MLPSPNITANRIILMIVSLVMVVLTACTSRSAGDQPTLQPTPRPSPRATAASPVAAFRFSPPLRSTGGGQLGDQTNQWLNRVTARGRTVVAAGVDESANVQRPLLVVSRNGGTSWTSTSITGSGRNRQSSFEVVDQLASGAPGFLVLGHGTVGALAWLSTDGVAWRRANLDPRVFTRADSVSALVWTPQGWLAAGEQYVPAGTSLATLVLWRSRDGMTWHRSDLSGAGLKRTSGTPSVTGLAVDGADMLLVGGIEDNRLTEQPNRLAVWRSSNRGRSWAQVPTRPGLGGSYRAYAADLTRIGRTYYLTVAGDGADGHSWDAVVLSSSTRGRHWRRVAAPAAFGTPAEEHPATLVRLEGRWVLAGRKGDSPSDALVTAGKSLAGLRSLSLPSLTGQGDQQVAAGVAVGRTAVLVGSSAATGSTEPGVWLVSGDSIRSVPLPASVHDGRPTLYVNALAQAAPGQPTELTAVGTVAGSPVSWDSRAGTSWTAAAMPGRSRRIDRVDVTDVAVAPGGATVAVGSLAAARGEDAAVWVRPRGGSRWRLLTAAALKSPVPEHYGYLEPTSVATSRTGWVVAGTIEADGHQDGAILFSRDGKRWRRARGLRAVRQSAAETYDHRTPWSTFRGVDNGEISMADVTATGEGFAVAGSISDGNRSRPPLWRSDDGVTWGSPVSLPQPAGSYAARGHTLTVRGAQLVVTGRTQASAADEFDHSVSWVSRDGGQTWRSGAVLAGAAQLSAVTVVPGGFVATGDQGRFERDAAAWTSVDGLVWRSVNLGLSQTAGPGNQGLGSSVVHRGRLVVVGLDVPPSGGGFVSTAVAVPQP